MHIAITGNIGAGKTTLTDMLAKHYGFALQIYFLGSRFRQVKEIRESGQDIIQDRTIYEDAYIFAENLKDMGLLSNRDYQNYSSVFNLMINFVSPPDLLIYLKSDVSTLIKKINKRGRDYESSISRDYLSKLNDKYEKWISNYNDGNLLILEMGKLDFVENPNDFQFIINEIDKIIKNN